MVYDALVVGKVDPHNFAYVPTRTPVKAEDGDSEVLCVDLEANDLDYASVNSNSNLCVEGEVDIIEYGASNLLIIEFETQDAMSKMLNLENLKLTLHFPYIR